MGASYLVVARRKKAHGLKGALLVEALTDSPQETFVAGRRLSALDEAGVPLGGELVVSRARRFQGQWLLELRGVESRTAADALTWTWLGARSDELAPPAADQMYLHELAGAQVVAGGRVIGVARELVGTRGELLAVEAEGKEHLIPFRRPIVRGIDRASRRIDVELPPGLLEL